MKWNETNYPRIGETVLRTTLPNGLTVAVVPKPLYRKRYAFFTTRYGGMDMRVRRDGVVDFRQVGRTPCKGSPASGPQTESGHHPQFGGLFVALHAGCLF